MTTCKNCSAEFEGRFCSNCGQKNYTAADKSVKHLFEEFFHFITHFEGAFFTTLKVLFAHPGKLTIDYCNGVRKKYFKPVSFYLLLVVIYLIFPLASGLNMQMKVYSYMSHTGKMIGKQITAKATRLNITEEELGERFKEKSHTTSKFLLFLFIPLSALMIFILYPGKRRMMFDNLILATEINIMYVLVIFLIFPALYFAALSLMHLNGFNDEQVGTVAVFVFALYVAALFHKVLQSNIVMSLIKGLAFSLLHIFIIVPVYKLLVFEITLALVKG